MITPRLAITSPTKGCGKTTLLDVVEPLVFRPLAAANCSASSIFRVVEGHRPCLLIDEADSFLSNNEELRGVLNSGHRRGGAVLRNVGDEHEPRSFSTFAACAIALIGRLPGTLADRAVPIDLVRRKADEAIEPFRFDRVDHLAVLARKLMRWTKDNADAIAATRAGDAGRLVQPGCRQLARLARDRHRRRRRLAGTRPQGGAAMRRRRRRRGLAARAAAR